MLTTGAVLMITAPGHIMAAVGFALDYTISVNGIKAGVAEEGNWFVRKFYGGKPNALQLLATLLPQDLIFTVVAIAAAFLPNHNPGFALGLLGGQIARHLVRVRQWEKLGAKL